MIQTHREPEVLQGSTRVRTVLGRILDVLAIIFGAGLLTVPIRIEQFGLPYLIIAVVVLLCCVLPALLLRQDRFLSLRGALATIGALVFICLAMIQVGASATSYALLPFLAALASVFFNRVGALIYICLSLSALTLVGYGFVSGILVSPDITLADWNSSFANWFVLVFTASVSSFLVAHLVSTLSRNWVQSDDEANNSARQFESLVETAPDVITVVDVDTMRFTIVNARAEELFGYTKAKLLKELSFKDLSPEFQPNGETSLDLASKYIGEALEGGRPTFLWIHMNAAGEEIPCEISLSRLPPFRKKLVRGSIVDIRQRLKEQQNRDALQSQLAAAQRLETIGQLTGGVAHDFNNLLSVILGNLELVQGETDERIRDERMQACVDASLRGADLTRSMLNYARQAPLQPKQIDLNTLVRTTKNWAGRTLPAHIDVETSLLAGLWRVNIDPSVAESALLNLMLNARDAMPTSGKLTIETANIRIDEAYVDGRNEEIAPGRYVMVAVSDTGGGIDKATLERIFDPFFTTKGAGQGSGLGLAMVIGFMRQSNGTVQVYSEVGFGTTFKLYFPAEGPTEQPLPVTTTPTTIAEGGGKRILVAEDESAVLEVLETVLATAGYDVVSAPTGDAAKALFEVDPTFDLLLTDIVMPGSLQGTGLSKALRTIKADLPVVFMSGYAAEATVHGNGLRPEDIRLMKPVKRSDLLGAVAKALET